MECSAAGSRSQREDESCAQRLATFDSLDYDVFSNQKGDRLSESPAQNIVVTWPDGRETVGIDTHLDDLRAMFVYAPNTSIKEHPAVARAAVDRPGERRRLARSCHID